MKHALNILLLTAALTAPVFAQECSKNSDACASTPSHRSPFLEASSKPDSAAHAVKAVLKKTVKTAAAAPAQPVIAAVPAATPAPVPMRETFSNPFWLLFAFGGLACLYLYLKNGKKGRKK